MTRTVRIHLPLRVTLDTFCGIADERVVGHEIFVSVAARTPQAERMQEIVAEHTLIIALAYTQCCTTPGPASGLYRANRKARSSWS